MPDMRQVSKELVIEIPCLPPSEYSGNSTACWQARHRANRGKRGPGQAAYACMVDARNRAGWQKLDKAVMEVEVIFDRKLERDADNLRSRFKVFQDALVWAEIIAADDDDHLKLVRLQITVDKARAPLTRIRVREG